MVSNPPDQIGKGTLFKKQSNERTAAKPARQETVMNGVAVCVARKGSQEFQKEQNSLRPKSTTACFALTVR